MAKRVLRRRRQGYGVIQSFVDNLPWIILAGIFGLIFYNPSGYSFVDLITKIFTEDSGVLEGLQWYYQPIYWALLATAVIIVTFVLFNWQVAKDEKTFLTLYILLWVVVNGIILAIAMAVFQAELLNKDWVLWQISPLIFSTLVYGAKIPRTRRAYSGAITAGGGSMDVDVVDGHDHDDDHHH